MSETLLDDNDMLPEYDFSNAKRAPYAEHFLKAGVRTLDADLRDAFPSSESVNRGLRSLLETRDEAGLRDLKRAR